MKILERGKLIAMGVLDIAVGIVKACVGPPWPCVNPEIRGGI